MAFLYVLYNTVKVTICWLHFSQSHSNHLGCSVVTPRGNAVTDDNPDLDALSRGRGLYISKKTGPLTSSQDRKCDPHSAEVKKVTAGTQDSRATENGTG